MPCCFALHKPIKAFLFRFAYGADAGRFFAGAELGAVPLAAAVSLQTRLPFVIVKKQVKDYGTSKPIEGVLEPGDKVTLVEDIITTAGQCIKAADALKAAGAEVVKIIGILDRQEGGAENIRAAGYAYEPLFVKSDMGV